MTASTQLQALFPTAFAEADTLPGLGEIEVDVSTPEGVRSLYTLIVYLENTSQSEGLEGLVRTACALRKDLLRLAGVRPRNIDHTDFCALLLATALGPARVAVTSGRVNVAYDWLLWSLTSTWEVDGEHAIHTDWVWSAAYSRVIDPLDEIVRPWLTTLYHYDWLAGGLPSVAEKLLSGTLELAITDLSRADFDLAVELLGWANHRSLDAARGAELRKIGGFLASLADNECVGPQVRFRALRPLALCAGTVTGQDQTSRSQQLLDEFGSDLSTTDKLGALGNLYAKRPLDLSEQIDVFVELALDHHRQFEAHAESVRGVAWARGAMHSLVNLPIRTLLLDGRVDPAVRLLRAWRGLDHFLDAQARPLMATLLGPNGLSWVAEDHPGAEAATGVSLSQFQAAANAFLGNTVTVATNPGMALEVGERGRGFPNEAAAVQFQVIAETFLNVDEAQRVRAATTTSPTSLLLLPTIQAPVQALMTRHLGSTLPLWVSLEPRLPDRTIRNALLYLGGSLFSPKEQDILEAALSAAGVQLTLRTEINMTRHQFLEDYKSDDFDLIWVGTHGVFDGLQPDDAHLHLSDTERVGLDDLETPPASTRRLLVLNACDGAVTVQTGGIGELGLAAVAAASSQAVISHQWPIASSTTALMFAGVLGASLATASSFFEAYQSSLSLLGGDLPTLRHHVSNTSELLVRLLDDKPEEFERFSSWASAAFLE